MRLILRDSFQDWSFMHIRRLGYQGIRVSGGGNGVMQDMQGIGKNFSSPKKYEVRSTGFPTESEKERDVEGP